MFDIKCDRAVIFINFGAEIKSVELEREKERDKELYCNVDGVMTWKT